MNVRSRVQLCKWVRLSCARSLCKWCAARPLSSVADNLQFYHLPPPRPPHPSACGRAPVLSSLRHSRFPLTVSHMVPWMSMWLSPHIPLPPPLLPLVHRSVLYACFSTAALKINSSVPSLQTPYVCVSIQYLSFWLTSLRITGSSFVHLIRADSNAFLFMAEWYSTVCMHHSFFIHSSADGHRGCFHVLAIINSASVNTGVHVSFSVLVSSGYMPRSGIAGSYGGFIPSF